MSNNSSNGNTSFGIGVVNSATSLDRGYTALSVTMRAAPTLNQTNIRLYDGTGAPTVTGIVANFSTSFVGSYALSASGGGLTTGRACMVIENSSLSGTLDFSAEL
jgi:hypothetical protein